jgi:1,4-alpha-glucan branching enzyme
MRKPKLDNRIKNKKVTFRLKSPKAKKVILAGDFNNWDIKKHTMKKNQQDIWEKSLILPPGKYEYKFLVDGDWVTDPQNTDICRNKFGTLNNILNVTA